MKVMSFNIRYGTAPDGENSWPHRREWVLDRICAFDPDLLGLQECRDDEQADYIRAGLADYEFVGVRRGGDDDSALEMAPLLFKPSAFEELARGVFWLGPTPDVPGSKSWGRVPRTATWVKLAHRQSPQRELMFLNTHFDYKVEVAHQSAQLLRDYVDRLDPALPLILTGDFNVNRDTPPYHALAYGGKLRDAYRQVHPDQIGATFNAFGKRRDTADAATIDWILVSQHFETLDAQVDRHTVGSAYPSDHFPVLAHVALIERR